MLTTDGADMPPVPNTAAGGMVIATPEIRVCAIVVLIVALWSANSAATGIDFTVTPGLGHDQFTETFYIDDSNSVQLDSLERIKKTEDALQESYSAMGLGIRTGAWNLESTVYATDAVWRNISYLRGRISSGRLSARINSRLEWKSIDRDDPLASAYTFFRTDIKPQYRLNDRWRAHVRADWENADYRRNTSYTYDYTRLRTEMGMEYLGPMLQSIDLRVGIVARNVRDSSLLDYNEYFIRSDAFGWYAGNWRVSGSMSLTNRQYRNDTDGSDHRRYYLDMRADYDWSAFWRLYTTVEWQRWDYTSESTVLYDLDNWRGRASARAILAETWEFGGTMEFRMERPLADGSSENGYVQWGAGPVVEWRPSLVFSTSSMSRINVS